MKNVGKIELEFDIRDGTVYFKVTVTSKDGTHTQYTEELLDRDRYVLEVQDDEGEEEEGWDVPKLLTGKPNAGLN